MDWSKGITATYYGSIVDSTTWRDIDRFEITGGRISRSLGELVESANVNCTGFEHREKWIRIWLNAKQGGESSHIALFTGLATSPSKNIRGYYTETSLECYSVLKPLQDILLPRGWYAPQGSGKSVILDLLSATPAPSEIEEGIPLLRQNIIAEERETYLSMLNKILLALNWRIKIAGDGTIRVVPISSKSVSVFGNDYDMIETELNIEYDWYKCPNVFRAISGDESEVVMDDSDSVLSVGNRGREIWDEDTSCNLNAGETLYEYAQRRLKEKQRTEKKVSYSRRFDPDIYVTDVITINYPQVQGTFFISSQTIDIGHEAKTTEEVMI